jgi:hypothetical protein
VLSRRFVEDDDLFVFVKDRQRQLYWSFGQVDDNSCSNVNNAQRIATTLSIDEHRAAFNQTRRKSREHFGERSRRFDDKIRAPLTQVVPA